MQRLNHDSTLENKGWVSGCVYLGALMLLVAPVFPVVGGERGGTPVP